MRHPRQRFSERYLWTLWGVVATFVAIGIVVLQLLAAGHCDSPGMLCWACPLLLPLEWLARTLYSPELLWVVVAGFLLHWPLLGLMADRRRARAPHQGLGPRRSAGETLGPTSPRS